MNQLKTIGKMNLKNSLILILFTLVCFNSYSQDKSDSTHSEYPKAIIVNGDTIIAFTPKQAIDLAVRNEKLKECGKERYNLNLQVDEMDSINKNQESKISDLYSINDEEKTKNKAKDVKLDICDEEKNNLKDEVQRQKLHKWIAIIAGTTIAIIAILL